MQELSAIQARVLGALVEKQATTPDQYPLTLNAVRTACNQKTARDPVTSYSEGEVGHCLRELEGLKLVREVIGARAHRYEQLLGRNLGLHSPGLSLLAILMLRGPQTLGELRNHSHRLHEFDDLDDVQYQLDKLAAAEPPLVTALPRQPGQKEGRYAHLLCGQPPAQAAAPRATYSPPAPAPDSLEQRVSALEDAVETLQQELAQLRGDH